MIIQNEKVICKEAELLYKPMSEGDCWNFLNCDSGAEIMTNERLTIIKIKE